VHAYGYENHNLATSDADDDWENHKKQNLKNLKSSYKKLIKKLKLQVLTQITALKPLQCWDI
jgi:hypothetical protein